ncbi:hypothetical protein [Candidatus Neptunochlamydia vexilliferae]|uniref:Uncharacterized protein n=1 Tax=Candidatus Neptunichlamydia vexilliferae TaxID=1651774 RepID=A0ABS0B053_9BACT|nr:hypothetical protein [Candidatus Neptunochlamydia vexilliferae]MBF5059759.1 hypothetical protein [Candidatus Neptunochlamydia vexilliferae]
MKNSPHRMKHQQKKAIRAAQKEEYETKEKKMLEKDQKKALTSPKTNKIAKGKASSKKKSHMTSPKDITWETEPESIHKEGKHWIQTIQKQTLDTASRLRKKLQKLNFLKRK